MICLIIRESSFLALLHAFRCSPFFKQLSYLLNFGIPDEGQHLQNILECPLGPCPTPLIFYILSGSCP